MELSGCPTSEEGFDYCDRNGAPRVKTYSCRRLSTWMLRPATQLFELLEGWDFAQLRAEGRLNPQSPLFGLKASTATTTTTQ